MLALKRRLPPAAGAFALGGVTVLALGIADGGFFASSWRLGALGLGSAAAIALLVRERIKLSRSELWFLGGLAAFAAWVAASAAWADERGQALLEAERAFVYVAGVLAGLVVVARRFVPQHLAGIVAAAVVLAVVSVATRRPDERSLEGPIGYANALGIVAAVGILLALGLAIASSRRRDVLLAAGSIVPLAIALVLSGSRGGALALGAGIASAAFFARRRLRVVLAAAVVVLAAAGAIVIAVRSLDFGDRPDYWRVAWAQFAEHPLVGAGAGAFHRYWLEHRPDPGTLDTPEVLDAHSLYLETLAELGVIGFAVLAGALTLPLVAAVRARRDPGVAVATPAYVAFLIHAGLDWDWEMPAVTLAGLFCGCAVLRSAAANADAVDAKTRRALVVVAIALILAALARSLFPGTAQFSVSTGI